MLIDFVPGVQKGKNSLGREKLVSKATNDFITMLELENWDRRATV